VPSDDYDLSLVDLEYYNTLCSKLSVDKKSFSIDKFARVITVWEHDAGKGEIFPIERAFILVKENDIDFTKS
jgi:hypothetical protein